MIKKFSAESSRKDLTLPLPGNFILEPEGWIRAFCERLESVCELAGWPDEFVKYFPQNVAQYIFA
jgi:hypothetical protein